jgi:hypothetical protein
MAGIAFGFKRRAGIAAGRAEIAFGAETLDFQCDYRIRFEDIA